MEDISPEVERRVRKEYEERRARRVQADIDRYFPKKKKNKYAREWAWIIHLHKLARKRHKKNKLARAARRITRRTA